MKREEERGYHMIQIYLYFVFRSTFLQCIKKLFEQISRLQLQLILLLTITIKVHHNKPVSILYCL